MRKQDRDGATEHRITSLMDPRQTPGWSPDERLQAALFILSQEDFSPSDTVGPPVDRILRRARSHLRRVSTRRTTPLTTALIEQLAVEGDGPSTVIQKRETVRALLTAITALASDDREFFLRVALLDQGTEKAARQAYGHAVERTQAWRIYQRLRADLRRSVEHS